MTPETAILLLVCVCVGGSLTRPHPEPHVFRDLINATGRPEKASILAAAKLIFFLSELTLKDIWFLYE